MRLCFWFAKKSDYFEFFESPPKHSSFEMQNCVFFRGNTHFEQRFLVVKAKFSFLRNLKTRCYCVPKIRKLTKKLKKTKKDTFLIVFGKLRRKSEFQKSENVDICVILDHFRTVRSSVFQFRVLR